MFYYDRIIFYQGIDVNKTYESRKCIIFNNFILLKVNFKSEPRVCNGYYI